MSNINEKHLEFIQGVINRHNSNSFRIKGWAITITAAIFALTGTIKEPYLCFVALGPILMFWVLDSIFLANERCFVSLYTCVSKDNKLKVDKNTLIRKVKQTIETTEKEYSVSNYSMNFVQFREIARNNWWSALLSYTIVWFYSVLIILTVVTFLGLTFLKTTEESKPLNINATITNSDSIKIKPIDINAKVISIDTLQFKNIDETSNSKESNPTNKPEK